MAERSFPLDETLYYSADMRLFHAGRHAGVIGYTNDDFGVAIVDGMSVTIRPGVAFLKAGTSDIGGLVYKLDSNKTFTFSAAGSTTRYDYISIRYDSSNNRVSIDSHKGTNVIPIPVRTSSTYEIIPYVVEIPANASSITMRNVTDKRIDESMCGYAVDTLARVPTQELYNSYTAFMEQLHASFDGDSIGKITNRIVALEASDKAQDSKIASVKSEIGTVSSSVNALDTQCNAVSNAISETITPALTSLRKEVDSLKEKISKPLTAYPIGSVYISTTSTNPGTLFGGSWTRIGQGRCLIGEGSLTDQAGNSMSFGLGATGGYFKSEILAASGTINQNTNTIGYAAGPAIGGGVNYTFKGTYTNSGTMTGNVTHSTRVYERDGSFVSKVQPYLVVVMWKRTA